MSSFNSKTWTIDSAHTPRRPITRLGAADPRPIPPLPALADPRLAAVEWREIPGYPLYAITSRGLVASWHQPGGGVRAEDAPRRLLTPYWRGATLRVTLFLDGSRCHRRLRSLIAEVWSERYAEWFDRRIYRYLRILAGKWDDDGEPIWLKRPPVVPAPVAGTPARCPCCGRSGYAPDDFSGVEG